MKRRGVIDFSVANGRVLAELRAVQDAARSASALMQGQRRGSVANELIKSGQFFERVMAQDIEVDTGRTKNATFGSSGVQGRVQFYAVQNNVEYAPYVRDERHGENFMVAAFRRHGEKELGRLSRRVADLIGKEF